MPPTAIDKRMTVTFAIRKSVLRILEHKAKLARPRTTRSRIIENAVMDALGLDPLHEDPFPEPHEPKEKAK